MNTYTDKDHQTVPVVVMMGDSWAIGSNPFYDKLSKRERNILRQNYGINVCDLTMQQRNDLKLELSLKQEINKLILQC